MKAINIPEHMKEKVSRLTKARWKEREIKYLDTNFQLK